MNPDLAQPQLFLDDTWISFSHNAHRVWHQARKYPEPVIRADLPWEYGHLPVCAYGTFLFRENMFRAWYMAEGKIGYAESADGVHWTKPHLGLHEINGDRNNNVVISEPSYIDDVSVIETPEDAKFPLKALYWVSKAPDGKHGIILSESTDGIHWESRGKVLDWGDRFNAVARKVNGKYLIFGRDHEVYNAANKGRVVVRSESDDLKSWSKPELVFQTDLDDPVCMQSYSMTVFPYSDLLVGGLERMYFAPDKIDTEIVWSRDLGRTWARAAGRPRFIEWGLRDAWDSTWLNLPSNPPILQNRRLVFFYSGRYQAHGDLGLGGCSAIGVATLRQDGFCSIHSGPKAGAVVTRPMTWPGGELMLNFDARHDLLAHPHQTASGNIAAEARDESDKPIPGYTIADFTPQRINTANLPGCFAAMQWNNGKSAKELAGRRVRFLFTLRDCHLYAFKAGPV